MPRGTAARMSLGHGDPRPRVPRLAGLHDARDRAQNGGARRVRSAVVEPRAVAAARRSTASARGPTRVDPDELRDATGPRVPAPRAVVVPGLEPRRRNVSLLQAVVRAAA